ncbi:MAG: DUF3466 family protein [Chloroflexota bacterium]|nr:DUF3466 family protein [Chloroflexota bacterium]
MQIAIAAIIAGREARAAQQTTTQAESDAYRVIDLGTGNGNWSSAWHINNRSQVLWTWATAPDPSAIAPRTTDNHVVLASPDGATDLTDLGITSAIGINDRGEVLGRNLGDVFLYQSSIGDVQSLPELGMNATLSGINDAGAMVGTAFGQAVVVENGQSTTVSPPVGYDRLWTGAIANSGSIAATAVIGNGPGDQRAALIVNGHATVLGSAPAANGSVGVDVNEFNQLIAQPELAGARGLTQAGGSFVYDHETGRTTNIGRLPGYTNVVASAINNSGQVVGYAWLPADDSQSFHRAFLYDYRTDALTDLNTLIDPMAGLVLFAALDINDAGQIVGRGLINGEMHAFVLMPNS